jgi:hypothetical protein
MKLTRSALFTDGAALAACLGVMRTHRVSGRTMRTAALLLGSCVAACGPAPSPAPPPPPPPTSAAQATATPASAAPLRPASCPPEIRRSLPTYGGAFSLPPACFARCESGIDSVEATLVCGATEVIYSGAFERTIQLQIDPADGRIAGRQGVPNHQLYWGSTPDGRRCAILLVGASGEQLQHQFCSKRPAGSEQDVLLLELARSWQNTQDPNAQTSCPYCG